MHSFVCGFVCLALVAYSVHAATAALSDDVIASYVDAFEKYQVKFNKHYQSKEEYEKRLRVYATAMEEFKVLNAKESGVTFGETSKTDAFAEEMPHGAVRIPVSQTKEGRASNRNSYPQPYLARNHTKDNIPSEFNWFDTAGVKQPAVSQGNCGSCWAFSAAGGLEMQAVLEGYEFNNISRQQVIDCTYGTDEGGCCGGFPGNAFRKVKEYTLWEDYPYELGNWDESQACTPSKCRSSGKKTVYTIEGYDSFQAMSAADLKQQIWMYGPISIYLDAPDSLVRGYHGGIFECTDAEVGEGHYVIAIGFGPNYIVLRNSWGEHWGLDGDFLLSDRDSAASCNLTGPSQYLQMARVAVKPLYPESESYSDGVRALPMMMAFAILFIVSCLMHF